jgi:D-alanyl-D-alanine carboxypeptidase
MEHESLASADRIMDHPPESESLCGGRETPRPGSTAGSSAVKRIDQAALQTMLDKTAKELLVPGAIILLRTPRGEFTVTYGATLLGAKSPPRADTHFRAASNTKTMTAAIIMQLAHENKLSLTRKRLAELVRSTSLPC